MHGNTDLAMPGMELTDPSVAPSVARVSAYAWYALAILWLSVFFNYTDRQIFSILAEHMKRDLKLSDTGLGMLYGTVFVTFYTIVGLIVARLADCWKRTRLMGLGMVLWSVMTACIGIAGSFPLLALARSGVGVGEATASPCSYSLISDFFPARKRALALSLYLTGMAAGTGLSVVLGAVVATWWDGRCSVAGPCGLFGWQVAFILIGIAGLPVAVLVLRLKEPQRGVHEGAVADDSTTAASVRPGRILLEDALAILPLANLVVLSRVGGARAVRSNLAIAAGAMVLGFAMWRLTGDAVQWSSVAVALFAISSWAQLMRYRRPDLFACTLGSRFFWFLVMGACGYVCVNASVNLWAIPYALRTFPISLSLAGAVFGPAMALGSAIGMVLGGVISTYWQRWDMRAPVWITMLGVCAVVPLVGIMLTTDAWKVFGICLFLFSITVSTWAGPAGSLILNIVTADMRASAASIYVTIQIAVSMSVGPYATGKISQATGSLGTGIAAMLLLLPLSLILLWLAARRLDRHSLSVAHNQGGRT